MKELVDYIRYHGYIASIRDNVDKDYIWIDIGQKEPYKDKQGMDRINLSFFSARMYIEYSSKIDLIVGKDIYVQGIPKGYIDKNGLRQNYIHILEINGVEVSKEPTKETIEKVPLDEEDKEFIKEWEEFIKSLG